MLSRTRFTKFAFVLILASSCAAQTSDIFRGFAHPPLWRFVANNADIGILGYTPGQIRAAYGISQLKNGGIGQIIGIVDAYDDPQAEADLATFSAKFHLPACTTANGCFRKIMQSGTPPDTTGWTTEIVLDTQWAHAIAPQARILLVEAKSNNNGDMYRAVELAVQHGATVVSMSWDSAEAANETQADAYFQAPGVTYVAASGDSGHGTTYPPASPYVVGAGGTAVSIDQTTGAWLSETAWSGSGGGLSVYEPEPPYQVGFQTTGHRGVPDVAFDADPGTGVPVFNSYNCGGVCATGWGEWGGTSLATPCWAGIFALVNSERVANGKATLTQPLALLYAEPESVYHDIISGRDGNCAHCVAMPGYDFVTGLGSPVANLLVPVLVSAP